MKIALTNVRVFDGRRLVPGSTVVIEDALIGSDPAAARRVDGAGRVLLPGLIDAHVHVDSPQHLAALASYGVTTALDMASVPGVTAPLRGLAAADALVAAAHEGGKLAVAHASSSGSVAKAQAAGADILTHAPLDQPLDAAAVAQVVAGGPGGGAPPA